MWFVVNLKRVICIKELTQFLFHKNCSINVSCYYFHRNIGTEEALKRKKRIRGNAHIRN